MGVIPPSELATSNAPFADAAGAMWGSWAAYAVGAGAVVSCFGALNGWLLLQGQIPRAAARDGLFPQAFARISKFDTPAFGLVFSSILSSIVLVMNYNKGLVEQFTFIILLATLNTLVPYVFCSLSEIMMVVKGSKRVEGQSFTGLAILSIAAFAYALWAIAGAGPEIVYWVFLLLMSGVPVYVWIQRNRSQPTSWPQRSEGTSRSSSSNQLSTDVQLGRRVAGHDHQETLTVSGDVVIRNAGETRVSYLRSLEKKLRSLDGPGGDSHGHHAVAAPVKKLPPGWRPCRGHASFCRNSYFPTRAGKRLHVDLVSTRLVGRVGDEAAVGREDRAPLVERGSRERSRFAVVLKRQYPDVVVGFGVLFSIGEDTRVRRHGLRALI